MKIADYIAADLSSRGVSHVYELVGGMISFLLDAIARQRAISIVSMHHEQACAFAGEGHGRIRGLPCVVFATSGPGALNLLTGIGSCYFDSTPAIFITGQVNRHEMKGTRRIRQLGFQETDIVSIAKPITKLALLVDNPQNIPKILDRAFEVAMSGRPGPVLLDIPLDVQCADIDASITVSQNEKQVESSADNTKLHQFLEIIHQNFSKARRPLILAGGGIRSNRAVEEFRQFVHLTKLPVVCSLMGMDVLPSDDPYKVGMIGSYGNRWANKVLDESDALLVLGSRLTVMQTGENTKAFSKNKSIFHVDLEVAEMNNRVTGCQTLVDSLDQFLKAALACKFEFPDRSGWLSHIRDLKAQWPDTRELHDIEGLNPNRFLHQLSAKSTCAAAYVVDVGQHQMWAAQSLDLQDHQRFLTSGGLGSMGFSLPAAIGACFASDRQPVVAISGDGGFQCNIQELQTVRRNNLPLKIVILNNQCHGLVRQFQESDFEGRYQSTLLGYSAPSFHAIASAYGINSLFLRDENDVDMALGRLWEHPDQPFVLEVEISQGANAYPKLISGRSFADMEPRLQPLHGENA